MRTLKGLLNLTKRSARWIVAFIIVLLLVYGYYILFIRNPYTTDAFVQGHWLKVAARVDGPVVKLNVVNNQEVHKGQVLFQIDPTLYRLRMNSAAAKLHAINQSLSALEQEIKAASYMVREREAQLKFAQIQYKRFIRLQREGAVSIARYDAAQEQLRALRAERQQAIYTLNKLEQQLGSIETNGRRAQATAELNLARKKLSYTTIIARASGKLSNFYVRVGDYIKVGEPLFSIVENEYWWVQANYLEYELRRIKPNQSADVIVSMYPGHVFKGSVTSVGAGISRGRNISKQNTLPIVKESINWLRLFSRFPVFIHITDTDKAYPLRVGATAIVMIHVR